MPSVAPTAKDDTPKTINAALSSLPELKMKLPKSLSLDAGSSGKQARAIGDVTELNTSNVGSVKSQAWMNLQSGSFVSFLNKALVYIEDYAKTTTIAEGQSFSLSITNDQLASMLGGYVPSSLSLQNKFLVQGSDPKDFYLYAHILMTFSQSGSNYSYTILTKLHILNPESGDKKIGLWMDFSAAGGGMNMTMRAYCDVDATTGACTMVSGDVDGSGAVGGSQMNVMLTDVASDGSITDTNATTYQGNSNYYVAYGNDTAGGIASISSGTYCDSNNVQQSCDYYWSEYYNSNGDIISRANGDSHLWAPDTTNATNLYGSLGGTSAPETIYVKYDYTNSSYSISSDKISWTTVTPSAGNWGWYYKQGSNWNSGDAYYYWRGWESADTGYIYTLYAGFKVPQAFKFNGKSYFITNEYPLRNLLPLATAYQSAFALKQKEGDTYSWTWTDCDGNPQTNNYTCYSFWLENLLASTNDPMNYNYDAGDIDLNDKLSQYDMYYYNSGTLSKVKSYFFRTTTDIPPYFSNPDPTGISSSIKDRLQSALTTACSLNISNYSSNLVSISSDSAFTSLSF